MVQGFQFPRPLCPSLSLNVHPLPPSLHLAPLSLTQLGRTEYNHGTHTHPRASWVLVLGWTLHTCLMLCWVQSCRCHSAESLGVLLKVTPQPHSKGRGPHYRTVIHTSLFPPPPAIPVVLGISGGSQEKRRLQSRLSPWAVLWGVNLLGLWVTVWDV